MTIDDVLAQGAPPIVAILRGIRVEEAVAVGRALVAAGIRIIEVPFNSPEPELSIAGLAEALGMDAVIGGGTVLTPEAADRLADAGGRIMVSPNTDAAVIARGLARGMEPMPGFVTPTEAFAAVAAGARRLKLFPASAYGPGYLKALREVLPSDAKLWAVGGTGAANIGEWLAAGAEGIGVGGALYRAGDSADAVAEKASALVAAWHAR
jgi:2-dehydro-3-deoxyphosphogalactonate aldolase